MASAAVYDFRVVIDVSGSMKKTDPQNLRVPALKLINGLIPSGSRAGVWIFGKYVDMAVKWGEVNDNWRQQADLGANKIPFQCPADQYRECTGAGPRRLGQA